MRGGRPPYWGMETPRRYPHAALEAVAGWRIVQGCVRIRGPVVRKPARSGGLSWDVYELMGEGLGPGGFSAASACGDTDQLDGATAFPAPGAYTSLDDPPPRGLFLCHGPPRGGRALAHVVQQFCDVVAPFAAAVGGEALAEPAGVFASYEVFLNLGEDEPGVEAVYPEGHGCHGAFSIV